MDFTPASSESLTAFLIIILTVLVLILAGVAYAAFKKRENFKWRTTQAFLLIAIWVGVLSALSLSGWLERSPMPGIPVFFAIVLVGAITFSFSRFGNLLMSLPLSYLVFFQGFRLPLELVLHSWAEQGTVPPTMTWTGQNFDLIAGLWCLILGFFVNRFPKAAWIANWIGIICLLNVIRVAVMSSPLPFAWQLEKPLLLALYFPYLLIGPLAVGAAFAGHIILTRRIIKTTP